MSITRAQSFVLILSLALLTACRQQRLTNNSSARAPQLTVQPQPLPESASPQLRQMLAGAVAQIGVTKGYDPAYTNIGYPNGDVPIETGVCTDVVVRAFRQAGVDLQKEVHEDMKSAWSAYPRKWSATGPDSNIDHRRVPNLMTYFARQNKAVPMSTERGSFLPGDIVTWDLGGGVDHIGIVSGLAQENGGHALIIHNIGAGTKAEDVLFNWKITGHYRYF